MPVMVGDALKNPIRSLPVGKDEDNAPDVQVQAVPMTYALATQWHTQVQPLIDAHFGHASNAGAAQRVRADVGWDWPKQWLLAGLHTRLLRPVHGPALALCLVVDTASTGVFPIGMQRLPEDSEPITPGLFRRFDDPAQYFHFDQVQANGYCRRFDPRR